MLLADDNKQPRVSLGRPEKGLVVSECRTDEQDIIKPVTERATELVYEELPLPRVGRHHDEGIEGDIVGIHFNTAQNLAVCSLC